MYGPRSHPRKRINIINPSYKEEAAEPLAKRKRPAVQQWTDKEVESMMRGVGTHGQNWNLVQEVVGTKTEQECQSKYNEMKRNKQIRDESDEDESNEDEREDESHPIPKRKKKLRMRSRSSRQASQHQESKAEEVEVRYEIQGKRLSQVHLQPRKKLDQH